MIRRRKTGNAIFLAILLACSAGAIGFSSWSSGEGVFGTSTDILTEVGNGYYTHDYITVNQKNVGFKYSNSGFVDFTGKPVFVGCDLSITTDLTSVTFGTFNEDMDVFVSDTSKDLENIQKLQQLIQPAM